jgi:hypothetical protein
MCSPRGRRPARVTGGLVPTCSFGLRRLTADGLLQLVGDLVGRCLHGAFHDLGGTRDTAWSKSFSIVGSPTTISPV